MPIKWEFLPAFLAILPTYVLHCIQTCPTHTNGGGIGCDIIVYVIPLADAVFCLLPTQGIQKTQRERESGGGGGGACMEGEYMYRDIALLQYSLQD